MCRAEHNLELRERSFVCCDRRWDRDHAAAIILDEAGRSLGSGAGVRPWSNPGQSALVTAESHAL